MKSLLCQGLRKIIRQFCNLSNL